MNHLLMMLRLHDEERGKVGEKFLLFLHMFPNRAIVLSIAFRPATLVIQYRYNEHIILKQIKEDAGADLN